MDAVSEQEAARPVGMTKTQMGLLALAALLGVSLRLRALLIDHVLWLDEALLASNICGRSFRELLEPLDYAQGAPIAFLMAQRCAVTLLGHNELALRLIPFLASLATLVLIGRIASRQIGATGAVLGVTLAALMPSLIYYAGEAKQYAVDVCIALLLVELGASTLRNGLSTGRTIVLAFVGSLAVWSSHPSAFVLAAMGTLIVVNELRAKRADGAILGAGLSILWGVNFLFMYRISARNLNESTFLNTFWSEAFLPFPPRSPGDLRLYLSTFLGLFEAMYKDPEAGSFTSQRMSVAATLVWLLGIIVLIRKRDWRLTALLVGPLVFAAAAAALHKYPLRDRLSLFAVGPLLLMMTVGVEAAWRSADPLARTIGRLFVIILLLLPASHAVQFLLARPAPRSGRAALAQLVKAWQPGDVAVTVWISGQLVPFYRDFAHVDGLSRIAPIYHAEDPLEFEAMASPAGALRAHPRVWLIYSGRTPAEGMMADTQRAADHLGTRLTTIEANRVWIALYRFDRTWESNITTQ